MLMHCLNEIGEIMVRQLEECNFQPCWFFSSQIIRLKKRKESSNCHVLRCQFVKRKQESSCSRFLGAKNGQVGQEFSSSSSLTVSFIKFMKRTSQLWMVLEVCLLGIPPIPNFKLLFYNISLAGIRILFLLLLALSVKSSAETFGFWHLYDVRKSRAFHFWCLKEKKSFEIP